MSREQWQSVANFINDMLDCSVHATGGEDRILWHETIGRTTSPVSQKRAYRRMVRAGYNPAKLVEYAIETARGQDVD